jgi:glyoxylase-like metal-dependent hydrolase (beta-lactamase superfamily II)
VQLIAPDVWRLDHRIGPVFNVYLADDVLVDAGRRQDRGRILKQLEGRRLSLLALTHAHPDHQGAVEAVCEARGVPLACHADDVDAMEGRGSVGAGDDLPSRLILKVWAGPPRKVDRVLHEGDMVGDFRVVHAPGHAAGEIILFRDHDRVAICGDVIRNMSYATGRRRLLEPPDGFNEDSAQNRESIRKLAALEPSLLLPGHGHVVKDMDAFQRFAAQLP